MTKIRTDLGISMAIMAHPSRRLMVQDLMERLVVRSGPLGETVDPFVPTVVEDGGVGCWATAKRAWSFGMFKDIDYHLVLQDDALPCRDFVRAAVRALKAVPDAPVVSFYWQPEPHRPKEIELCAQHTGHWITLNCCPSGVAVAIRTALIPEMLNWIDTNFNAKGSDADDVRISAWLIGTTKKCWATLPSLCDHRGDVSVAGHNYPFARRAGRFVGESKSDTGIDWSRGVKAPPYLRPNNEGRFMQFVNGG